MYLNFNFLSFFLVVCVLQISCTKTVDIDIPQENPKQVISSYFITGDTIKALVSSSLPYTYVEILPSIDNQATVVVYENDLLLDTLLPKPIIVNGSSDSISYIYTSNKVAKPSATYSVVTNHPTLPKAFGIDAMPAKPLIKNLIIDSTQKSISFDLEQHNTTNYYLFTCTAIDVTNEKVFLGLLSSNPDIQIDAGDGFIYSGNINTSGLRIYLKNERLDTKKITFFYTETSSTILNDSITFTISHLSESYYSHEISKGTQEPIIPIFPEPSKLYTNVQNGYGVVACANTLKIQFKQ